MVHKSCVGFGLLLGITLEAEIIIMSATLAFRADGPGSIPGDIYSVLLTRMSI